MAYSVDGMRPSVMALVVHEEDEQDIMYDADIVANELQRMIDSKTTYLLELSDYYRRHPEAEKHRRHTSDRVYLGSRDG
jgi:hypothetical protein